MWQAWCIPPCFRLKGSVRIYRYNNWWYYDQSEWFYIYVIGLKYGNWILCNYVLSPINWIAPLCSRGMEFIIYLLGFSLLNSLPFYIQLNFLELENSNDMNYTTFQFPRRNINFIIFFETFHFLGVTIYLLFYASSFMRESFAYYVVSYE